MQGRKGLARCTVDANLKPQIEGGEGSFLVEWVSEYAEEKLWRLVRRGSRIKQSAPANYKQGTKWMGSAHVSQSGPGMV